MKKIGPVLIMLAASIWAIDPIFRTKLTFAIPSASIVFLEHVIGFLILCPFLIRDLGALKKLKLNEWLIIFAMTALSSVIGTLLFTEALNRSFSQFDYATPILLQKTQPVFVMLLSAIFLKEKLTLKFVFWAILAVIGSYLISFGWNPVNLNFDGKELVYLMSLGAAFSWGTGTILSKLTLGKLKFMTASALRFGLAIPFAFMMSHVVSQTYDFAALTQEQIVRFLIIGVAGAVGIYIYYKGLQTTQAKVSTFAELMFPIISIIVAITPLNPYGEAQQLMPAQILGIVMLFVSIIKISYDRAVKAEEN
jgi:drug/metabolite transporter (DMT)-like permease